VTWSRTIVVPGTMATRPNARTAWVRMQAGGGLRKLGHNILDEPAAIMEAMGRLIQGPTAFMMTHRLSTLEGAICSSRWSQGSVRKHQEQW
jgi:hypothetical protein